MADAGLMGDNLAWQELSGRWATIYTPRRSYAATRAQAMLGKVEAAARALERLLEPKVAGDSMPVDIYLADPAGDSRMGDGHSGPQVGAVRSDAIVRTVQPEDPDDMLIRPLTHLLAARWFGPNAASASLFLNGVAGIAAAQTGNGPSIEEIHDWVRAELAAGRPISILASDAAGAAPAEEPADGVVDDYLTVSFLDYLITTYGTEALRQFLTEFDPERRDQAAINAYQRPLGVLEEGWLGNLRSGAGGGTTFGSFFQHLVPLLKPYWRREVEILVYMLLGLGYTLALPLGTKYLFDTVIPDGSTSTLVFFVLGLFGIYALNAVIMMRRAYVNEWVNQRVLIDLQERLFAHLQRLSHNFYATAKVGDIMSRLTNDMQMIQYAMSQVAGNGIFMGLQAIAAAITMLYLDLLLGALIMVVVPIFAIGYFALRSRIQSASYERQQRTGEATTTIQENLSAYGEIKAFSLEDRAIASLHARLTALLRASLRLVVYGALFELSTAMAVSMGQLVVLGVGGYLVIDGQLTLGTLVAFIGLLPSLIHPISMLSDIVQTVQRASGSMDRVNEVLEEPVIVADIPGAMDLPPLSNEIRLEQASFAYGGNTPILQDLDLRIPAGANVAIVGPSGSGKSSIVNLLLRFWDPESGRVLYDGYDIREVTIDSLRGQIGIVFQDTFVFDTTVRENIAIGLPDASDADVVAAARAARLDSHIDSLPAGYDTVLGERGVRMSGGQRQRLAIARALIRDPRILVLDEATSALDAQTESEIMDTLAEFSRGRTTISITHRLTSVVSLDHIFVINQGQLVEQGTHSELVRSGGLYQSLYEEQTGISTAGTGITVETDRLRSIPLFADLPAESLAAVARSLTVERYEPDEDVVRQGDPGDRLYIINSGQAEVVITDGRRERQVNILNGGDYFGEMALLEDQPRAATVRTTMASQLYSLSQEDFVALLRREPAVRDAIASTVAARQRALTSAASRVTMSGIMPPAAPETGAETPARDSGRQAAGTPTVQNVGLLRPVGGSIGTERIVLPLAHPFGIGRASGSDLQLFDQRVSRQHATIEYRSGEYILTDRNSANGVYINGERVSDSATLRDGDRIKIGNVDSISFTFELTPSSQLISTR